MLDCYNYKNHGKCFVFSGSYDYIYYGEWSKGTDKNNVKREERRRERLNNLLKILGLD